MSAATAAASSRSDPRRAGAAPAGAINVGLFGCSLDTGNAGVTALGLSTIQGIAGAAPGSTITLFDFGAGERPLTVETASGEVEVLRVGCFDSRRYWQASNLSRMRAMSRLGLAGLHPMLRRMRSFDAILDISGGDSFADIYGPKRFNGVTLPKEIALDLGARLILLPQTYGPYTDARARSRAAGVLRGAHQVWARDERSLGVARELLGEGGDTSSLAGGVDVAFALQPMSPRDPALADRVERAAADAGVLVGLNVSGLLFNEPGVDRSRYGFKADYRAAISALIERLLGVDGVHLLLVPHVAPDNPMPDDDAQAVLAIERELGSDPRISALPRALDPRELKWCIARCDWFCGTRMHSCIGGLSLGVPTSAIAYSDKTLGVFETAGVGAFVVDPRSLATEEVVEQLMEGFAQRDRARLAVDAALPQLRSTIDSQFDRIVRGAVS